MTRLYSASLAEGGEETTLCAGIREYLHSEGKDDVA